LAEFVGQSHFLGEGKLLRRMLEADRLTSVIFYGPPGTGKTMLAELIAHHTGRHFEQANAAAVGVKEVRRILDEARKRLENDGRRTILFLDEIHRTPKSVEELLYPAMEDFAIDVIFDKGVHARSHRFRLKQFVLVGATTRVGLLSAPLRDRFGIFRSLDFYCDEDLERIVRRSAALLNLSIMDDGAAELARRSRGTPRIVNRLLKRVRDYAQVKADGRITIEAVEGALGLEGVDEMGLTPLDRRYLNTIIQYYKGGPVGIDAVAATLQEETDTLVDVVEPFLLKTGLILRTSTGRKASELAYQHLGISACQ
ncbi:MAG: Holliday junction branch migration DNA helicase RuvB, partial [Desulfobacterales bacterium]